MGLEEATVGVIILWVCRGSILAFGREDWGFRVLGMKSDADPKTKPCTEGFEGSSLWG